MPSALELIQFWSVQLSQHAIFLQLGLEPEDLKKEAGALHDKWEDFRSTIPSSASPDQTAELSASAKSLASGLRAFKTEVHDRLVQGEWLGWLFPSFVDHTRRELDYFVSSLNAKAEDLRVEDELCSWLRFMKEHAGFAAHLLDPQEARLVKQAEALADKFEDLEGGCKSVEAGFLVLSEKAGGLLDRYFSGNGIGTPKVLSVIHPVLALHVVREGRMFLEVLSELKGEPSTVEIPE